MDFKGTLKDKIIGSIPLFIRSRIVDTALEMINISYSQEGEDLILDRFFKNKKKGFFIDVGAHHPKRFSNTYKFYKLGWTGINIDAMPGSMEIFKQLRPNDINLEIAVSNQDTVLKYYIFNEPALNSFEIAHVEKYNNMSEFKVQNTVELKTQKLQTILTNYVTSGTTIDFLSIDVEGMDIEILESNDWKAFRPGIILIEEGYDSINDLIAESPIYAYLKKQGYTLCFRSFYTSFYKHL